MKKNWIVATCLMVLSMAGYGQAQTIQTNKKFGFTSINQLGLLTGQRGQAGLLQTINGITKDKWFAGIGTGLDYYGFRSIPLFIDVRRELGAKKNSPFFYLDGGVHFPYATDAQNAAKGFPVHSSTGLFVDGGLGFKLKLKGNNALLFSAGYSYKSVVDNVELVSIAIWPSPAPQYEYHKYQFRRIVIKMGIEL